MGQQYETIDEYIKTFPAEIQLILEKIRRTVREAAPGATETISYRMPAFKIKGTPLVYFAAYKKHIGLYPTPAGIEGLKEEFAAYKWSKGAVQLPLDKPIPYGLIKKLVALRLRQISAPETEKD